MDCACLVPSEMPVVSDHRGWGASDWTDDYNPPRRLETDILLTLKLSDVTISLPLSRQTRSRYSSSLPCGGWPRLIAQTYNSHPVGAFAGNFDKPINCNIRCGNTTLTYREFVNFRHHPVNRCHRYSVNIEKYKELETIDKIKSLVIADDAIEKMNLSGPATLKGLDEFDKLIYTCMTNRCIFPCLCYICNIETPRKCEHKILHPGFFDPKKHFFTVRNADTYDINLNDEHLTSSNRFCKNRKCRWCVADKENERSYKQRSCKERDKFSCGCPDCPNCKSVDILKYAGTDKFCEVCRENLLDHESYHFAYHFLCLFCRSSLEKFQEFTSEQEYWDYFEESRFQETISCCYCNRLFFDQINRKRHIQIVHKENPDYLFPCSDCQKVFGSKQALGYHNKTFHEQVDNQIACGICEKTFRVEQNLDDHMRQVHRNVRYECNFCSATFKRQSNLNNHYKVQHDTLINEIFLSDQPAIFETFKCDLCETVTREKRTLAHHMRYVHQKEHQFMFQCDFCDFENVHKKTLKRHINAVHKEKTFKCRKCSFRTIDKLQLTNHEQCDHLECDKCEFKTILMIAMSHHKKKHQKEETFHCSFCGFKNSKKKTLNRHMATVHKDECKFRSIGKSQNTSTKVIINQ